MEVFFAGEGFHHIKFKASTLERFKKKAFAFFHHFP
jgi:hypothetical protein